MPLDKILVATSKTLLFLLELLIFLLELDKNVTGGTYTSEEPLCIGWTSWLLETMSDCQRKARHPEEGGEWR